MKIAAICLLMVSYVMSEPPIDNRYLPPQQGIPTPSQMYGLPGSGFGNQRQPNSRYLPPQQGLGISSPSQTYGAPGSDFGISRGVNSARRPSSSYGVPTRTRRPMNTPRTPLNNYLPPSQGSQYQPGSQYQAPSLPSAQYGLPNVGQYNQNGGQSTPSQEYGVPGFGRADSSRLDITSATFGQSRQYLPPGRGGYDDGSNGEPANYNFEYMVKDEASGNDFGHRESRQGDRAEGVYYVLLPDGRKQTVEYEADQDGYKPRISYEDIGLGSGYDRNSQSSYDNQYPSGPY